MAQVSYGTITITDTNDIESIYMVYAGSSSDTQAPDKTNFNLWKTDISQVSGSYIWQRTVVKKSGIIITNSNFQEYYGDPVCITGPEGGVGNPGKSVESIITSYCNYGSGTPAANSNRWQSSVPTYDSNYPNYWVKIVITYSNPTDSNTKIYKDNGITDAIKTSNDANTTAGAAKTQAETAEGKADQAIGTANTANTNASNALSIATGLNQHFWIEHSDYTTDIPAGVYVTEVSSDTFKSTKTGGNIITRSDGIWIRDGVKLLTSLTGTALTFYNPSLSTKGIELDSNALKFYDSSNNMNAYYGDEIVLGKNLNYDAQSNNQIIDSNNDQLVDSSGNSIIDLSSAGISSSEYYVNIKSDGFYIKKGSNTLARYGEQTIFYEPFSEIPAATISGDGLEIQNGIIKLGQKQSETDTTNSGTYIASNGAMSTSNIIAHGGIIGGWNITSNTLERLAVSSEVITEESITEDTDGEGSSTDTNTNITMTSTVTLSDSGIIFNGTFNGENVKTSVQPTGIYSNSFYRVSGYGVYQGFNQTGVNLYCFGNNKEILRFASKTTSVSPASKRGLSFMIGNGYYTVGSGTNHVVDNYGTNVNVYLCGGTDETSKFIRSYPIYKRTYPSSNAANVIVTNTGTLGRVASSSIRYKHDVDYLTNEDKSIIDETKKISKKRLLNITKENNFFDTSYINAVLDIPLVNFKYNNGYITGEANFDYDKSIFGVIADDIANICPDCATYIQDENGNSIPESYNIDQIVFRMLYVIQQQEKRISELEESISNSENNEIFFKE